MRYGLLVVLLFSAPLVAFADIYQTIDSQGNAHFSDTPSPGSTIVRLNEDPMSPENTTPPPTAPVIDTSALGKSSGAGGEQAEKGYSDLKIVQPQTEATYFNNDGEVEVSIAVKPDIRKEDQAVMLVDGAAMPTSQNGDVLKVQGVERGAHSVQVQIQGKDGKALASSNTIMVNMRRPTVKPQGVQGAPAASAGK